MDGSKQQQLMLWTTAARVACLAAIMPMAMLTRTDESAITAAYLHLLLMPITTYVLQRYTHLRYSLLSPPSLLASVCILLANGAAVLLLLNHHHHDQQPPQQTSSGSSSSNEGASSSYYDHRPHTLLALALMVAAGQLLWVIDKQMVIRAMLCTATAMLVIALSIVGALAPPAVGRRFFQSATLPLVLLFMETSRQQQTTTMTPLQRGCGCCDDLALAKYGEDAPLQQYEEEDADDV